MQDFPHCYKIVASAGTDGDLSIAGNGLDSISCAPPTLFGGPGNRWSPETLLVAAVDRILRKAEDSCLITSSLSDTTHLKAVVLAAP